MQGCSKFIDNMSNNSGLFLGLHPANERCCYKVTPCLIGWAQAKNQPCNSSSFHQLLFSTLSCFMSGVGQKAISHYTYVFLSLSANICEKWCFPVILFLTIELLQNEIFANAATVDLSGMWKFL